jgi:hypothetical protein
MKQPCFRHRFRYCQGMITRKSLLSWKWHVSFSPLFSFITCGYRKKKQKNVDIKKQKLYFVLFQFGISQIVNS